MTDFEHPKVHVVAFDLDDTLVATMAHDEDTRAASDLALLRVGELVNDLRDQGETVHFGSATGRTLSSVAQLAQQRPAFGAIMGIMDFQITSVGATISSSLRHSNEPAGFSRILDWPNAPHWNRGALVDHLSGFPNLVMQPEEAQDSHKISYEADGNTPAFEQAAHLRHYLGSAGLSANVIVSGGGAWRFVDILPLGVDKGQALLQLPRLLPHSKTDRENVVCRIAAGDSLNDAATLAAADVSILPANAHEDLIAWMENNTPAGALYVAEERFAAGVLQGLQHHFGLAAATEQRPQ